MVERTQPLSSSASEGSQRCAMLSSIGSCKRICGLPRKGAASPCLPPPLNCFVMPSNATRICFSLACPSVEKRRANAPIPTKKPGSGSWGECLSDRISRRRRSQRYSRSADEHGAHYPSRHQFASRRRSRRLWEAASTQFERPLATEKSAIGVSSISSIRQNASSRSPPFDTERMSTKVGSDCWRPRRPSPRRARERVLSRAARQFRLLRALTQKPRPHTFCDSCRRSIVPSPRPRVRGHSKKPASSSPAPAARRRPKAMCCSRPAMARPACRISARSARSCAPPWCARPSGA